MIRRATAAGDIPIVEGMLRDMLAGSKYAGRAMICEKAMRELLLSAVAGQNQHGPQASFFRVSEHGGKVEGFMVGMLDRIYHIGDKLRANDIFLYVRPGAPLGHTTRLISEYTDWALGNPKVLEIMLSWIDTLPGAERIADLYRRKGFSMVGEIYELRRDANRSEAA